MKDERKMLQNQIKLCKAMRDICPGGRGSGPDIARVSIQVNGEKPVVLTEKSRANAEKVIASLRSKLARLGPEDGAEKL